MQMRSSRRRTERIVDLGMHFTYGDEVGIGQNVQRRMLGNSSQKGVVFLVGTDAIAYTCRFLDDLNDEFQSVGNEGRVGIVLSLR